MTEGFLASKFCLVFSGDEPIAFLCEGFDALGAKISEELGIGMEEYTECFDDIADEDGWAGNDHGPFSYDTEWGDGCRIQVYRIHQPE